MPVKPGNDRFPIRWARGRLAPAIADRRLCRHRAPWRVRRGGADHAPPGELRGASRLDETTRRRIRRAAQVLPQDEESRRGVRRGTCLGGWRRPECGAPLLRGELYAECRREAATRRASSPPITSPRSKDRARRAAAFQVPVYGRPPDLITIVPETERARFNDRITGFRDTPEGQVPYYTRAEINGGALAGRGLELLYLDDPVELFYMQVQGSGVVRLPDGSAIRLTMPARTATPIPRSASCWSSAARSPKGCEHGRQ